MGLIGGIARTAVIAGTATAVSNRVSRRQGNRWAQQEQDQYAQQQYYQQQQYAQQPQYAQPAPAPAPAAADPVAQLSKLAELKAQGALSDEEFTAMKAKILQ
jgi:Short C-terminal domain